MTPPDRTSGPLPDGPAWAAILAAGVGCAAFGLAVDAAEAFGPVSNALTLYAPAGNLSGKSAAAVAAWLTAWAVLHARWRGRHLRSGRPVMLLTVGLVVLALIAAFPPVFGRLARH